MLLLFYGDNTYAAKQKMAELMERYLAKNNDFGLERIDGTEVEPNKLAGIIQATPFLASSRLILIENLTKNKQLDTDKLEVAFNDVPDSTVVVVYEPQADKRTSVFKKLKQLSRPAEFTKLDSRQLVSWVAKHVQDLEGSISRSDAQYLVERAGEDQWVLHHEIEKLISYAPEITRENIELLVEPSLDQSIFELTDSLTASSPASAVTLYEQLRRQRLEPIYILTMLGWHLGNLVHVKAGEGKPLQQIIKEAKLSPFVARKSHGVASRLSLEALKQAFGIVLDADVRLKSAKVDADHLLERTIYDIHRVLTSE